jgi:undecaprenyl-diphosphatase
MSFLYVLQSLRNPVTDALFSVITLLGEESLFLAVALMIFWCVDKKNGYYLMIVSFVGLCFNQFLKLLCRIPRPWVLDPDFPIVESAREAATGYSFPSGHTQTAVGCYGAIARATKHRALRISMIVLIVLVAFSRMYLGVHTPWDVLVSLLIGSTLVLALYPLITRAMQSPRWMYAIISALILLAAAFAVYVECFPFPADVNAENLIDGRKNAWTILGCAIAMLVVYTIDLTRLHFDTKAPLPAQCCKLVLGVALLLLLKGVLKEPLLSLFGGHAAAHALRYFIVVLFAGAVWPMTFPTWTRLFTPRSRKSN